MKNQYFADINDYRKYGLLRTLAGGGALTTAICWMLTPNDLRKDGIFTSYLDDPSKWRPYDPELFDLLKSCITQSDGRSTSWAEAKEIIPGATYYSKFLDGRPDERRQYFSELRTIAAGYDLVFFDPDNGIEVQSTVYGSKYSNRYIYWGELADTFIHGQSLLVYQHFPRIKRDIFIRRVVDHIYEQLSASMVFTFSTAHVLFLLVSQPKHEKYFKKKYAEIAEKWRTQFQVEPFRRA